MTTIDQAAREYAQQTDKANAEWVVKDFKAGVEFTQRWISVSEEYPPMGTGKPILLRHKTGFVGGIEVTQFNELSDLQNSKGEIATHWRPIGWAWR